MRLGAQTVVGVALPAEITGQIVVVATQVERPAYAARIEDEAAQVEVAVVGVVVAAFDADPEGVG